MASFLSTATFSCTNRENTEDAAEALVYKNNEASSLRGRANAVGRCSTEQRNRQAEDLPGKIGAYGGSRDDLQGAESAT